MTLPITPTCPHLTPPLTLKHSYHPRLYSFSYHCHPHSPLYQDAQEVLMYFQAKSGSILPFAVQEKMRTLKNKASQLVGHVSAFGACVRASAASRCSILLYCVLLLSCTSMR